MSDALVPLLSVLLGAVLGAGATVVGETVRARNARRHDLLQIRREVNLDALEQVRLLLSRFKDLVLELRDGSDVGSDERQRQAVTAFFAEVGSLHSLSLRVSVLASAEVGKSIWEVEDRLREYVTATTREGVIHIEDAQRVLDNLHLDLAHLVYLVREDLRTAELDRR